MKILVNECVRQARTFTGTPNRVARLATLSAIVVMIATSLSAAPVTVYTDQGTFDAAAGALTTVTFDGIASTNGFVSYGAGSVTLSGATFANSTGGSGSTLFIVDPGFYANSYSSGFMTNDYSTTGSDVITVTLPGPETAVGFNFGSIFSGGATFTVGLDALGPFSPSTSGSIGSGTLGFVGYISTTPFSTVTLTLPDSPDYGVIDNFAFGAAGSSVPEPSTLMSLAGGLGILAFFARRRTTPSVNR